MIRRVLLYMVLSFGALFMAFPFLWMLATAFKTYPESAMPTLQLFPEVWQWSNIRDVFRAAPFGVYFDNTFFTATIVSGMVVFTSLMAGYTFARLRFPGRNILFILILGTMMVPFEVTLIPNYILVTRMGWYNTYIALVIPWCANAFSIFLMRQAFMALPEDFFDAARIDGCGHLRFLSYIAGPLVRPTVVTVSLFAFLGSYNALIWPIVVTGTDRMRVVQYGLTVFATAEGVQYNLLMCASAIVILPTVALYLAAQRFFLESALGSGIKG